jgi:hypothetical protein
MKNGKLFVIIGGIIIAAALTYPVGTEQSDWIGRVGIYG